MKNVKSITIGIVGTRGIPANYGGFETFAEELSIRLAKHQFDVNVYCDKESYGSDSYRGVKLRFMNVTKSAHPMRYYSSSISKALKECDFVIICGSPGALFLFHKLFIKGSAIAATNMDGLEHKRTKWNRPLRSFLRLTEMATMQFSDYVIADSVGIEQYLFNQYGKVARKKVEMIEYGAYINDHRDDLYLKSIELQHDAYYLVVSRLEPENNVDIIIDGYNASERKCKLVIVGNLLDTPFVESLKAKGNENILFLGGIYDKDKLNALRKSARVYFHGHSVGGTNPSLLEALGSGNVTIAHDNLFNRGVMSDRMFYFKDQATCSEAISVFEALDPSGKEALRAFAQQRINDYYNWDLITERYIQFIQRALQLRGANVQ